MGIAADVVLVRLSIVMAVADRVNLVNVAHVRDFIRNFSDDFCKGERVFEHAPRESDVSRTAPSSEVVTICGTFPARH